jgi:hypothetical protein
MDNLNSVDEVFQFMDKINTPQRDFLNTHYSKKINGAMITAIDKKFVTNNANS